MKKWIVAGSLVALTLGFIFLLYGLHGDRDVHYGSPDEVQNRPDVKEQIMKMFPHSKKLQTSSLEYARQFQTAISFPDLAREIYKKLDKARSCFAALYGDKYYIKSRELEAMVVNTHVRAKAYLKFNRNLSGHMYTVLPFAASDCHFDPHLLEN